MVKDRTIGSWKGSSFVPLQPQSRTPFSGARWALELSTEATRHPDIIDPQILRSAEPYAKLGRAYENLGYSRAEAAQLVAKEKGVAGWAKKTLFRTLYGTEPSAPEMLSSRYFPDVSDIQAGKYPGLVFGGPEFMERWNRATLRQKFFSSTVRGSFPLEQPAKAQKAGLLPEYLLDVRERQAKILQAGGMATPGEINLLKRLEGVIGQAESVERGGITPTAGASGLPRWLRRTPAFLWKHKLRVGLGAAVVGLYATQPLSLFSGKDDAWNTIEGLPHGGESERMRRLLTDFGSGLRALFGGIKNLAKTRPRRIVSSMRKWVAGQRPKKIPGLPLLHGGIEPSTGQKLFSFSKKEVTRITKEFGLGFFERRRIMPVLYGHEMSEMYHATRQLTGIQKTIGKFGMEKTIELAEKGVVGRAPEFGSHLSSAVVADEALLAAAMGPKTYQAAKKFRFTELQMIQKKIKIAEGKIAGVRAGQVSAGEGVLEQAEILKGQLEKYTRITQKIYGSVEKKHLSKFSGFTEEGIAAIRRENYGFSSGSSWSGILRFFGSGGQKLGTLGRKMVQPFRERIWGGKKGWVISAEEIAGASPTRWARIQQSVHTSVLERRQQAGLLHRTQAMESSHYMQPTHAEILKAEEGVILRHGGDVPGGPDLIRQLKERKQNELGNWMAQLNEDNLAVGAKASNVAAKPVPKKVEPQANAVVRKEVPKHNVLLVDTVISNRKRSIWHRKHREGQIRASVNATNPGRRHTQPAGKMPR